MCPWTVWYQNPCCDPNLFAPIISWKVCFGGLEKLVKFFQSLQIECKNIGTAGLLGRLEKILTINGKHEVLNRW